MLDNLPITFVELIELILKPAGFFDINHIQLEKESKKYNALRFTIHQKYCLFRQTKVL